MVINQSVNRDSSWYNAQSVVDRGGGWQCNSNRQPHQEDTQQRTKMLKFVFAVSMHNTQDSLQMFPVYKFQVRLTALCQSDVIASMWCQSRFFVSLGHLAVLRSIPLKHKACWPGRS